ncbi:MAG: inorganic phosphate transporter, partial [Cyanobacteria bacterium J06621_12]
VIFASRLGVPVSTTHVSVGSIFGVGVISQTAHLEMFSKVLSSWVLTLPIAAVISALTYLSLPK